MDKAIEVRLTKGSPLEQHLRDRDKNASRIHDPSYQSAEDLERQHQVWREAGIDPNSVRRENN